MMDNNKPVIVTGMAIALALVLSFGAAVVPSAFNIAFADKGDDGATEGTAIGNVNSGEETTSTEENTEATTETPLPGATNEGNNEEAVPAVEPEPTTIECIQAPCDVGTDDAATVAEASSESNSNEVSSIVLCIASIQDSANEEFVNNEEVAASTDNQTAEAIDNAVEEIANNTEAQVSDENISAVDEQASEVAEAVSDVAEEQPAVVSNETVAVVEDNANAEVVVEEIASDALANEIVEQADAQDDVNAVIGDAIVNNSDNATAAAEDIVEGVGEVADNTEVTPEDVAQAAENVNVTEVVETVNEVATANENGTTSDVVVDAVVDATSDDAAVNNDVVAPTADNGGDNSVISELVTARAAIQNALDSLQGTDDSNNNNSGGSVAEEPATQPATEEPAVTSSPSDDNNSGSKGDDSFFSAQPQ